MRVAQYEKGVFIVPGTLQRMILGVDYSFSLAKSLYKKFVENLV